MKILIVDDSRTARLMLKSLIPERENHEFCEAADGKSAIDVFNKENPDITFMDLTMPVMDGYEALEVIKGNHPGALIIVLSADIQKKAVERVIQSGAFKFLKKPPSPSDIVEVMTEISVLLKNRR
ncbi:MAG: response regulator [Spirochaetales bacterium]|nr:response regulator [Spirochaetales bacterium]